MKMRQYFRGNTWLGRIVRQSIPFLLACLFLTGTIPAGQRAAAAPITTTKHYEWKQIKTQADIPAAGTYPMLLCYTDWNGADWFLTGHTMGDGDSETCTLYRNGVRKKSTATPVEVSERLNEWKTEKNLPNSPETIAQYYQTFPDEAVRVAQYQAPVFKSEHSCNFMLATDLSDYPEIAVHSETFFTRSLPSDWSMTVTGSTENGLKTIYIRSGDKYMADGVGYFFMAEMEWEDEDDRDPYSIYTKDVGGDRADWTLDGCVQLFYYDGKLGFDTGLCWDYEKFGGIEGNRDDFSSFRLYYGVYREFSVIDRDYEITAGSILYADNDLELMPHTNLIIAPGGILSVTGAFLNNGVIHNCGTMILNPGSTVTSLEPEYADCGQLNCYGSGAASMDLSPPGDYDADTMKWYGVSETELSAEIMRLELELRRAETAGSSGRNGMTANPNGRLGSLKEEKAKLAEILELRREHPDDVLLKLRENVGQVSFSYSECEGNLVILNEAALLLPDMPDSRLNLYEGATCVNSGVIVAPAGISVKGGELTNRADGHIFIGYYFGQAVGSDEKLLVRNAGTMKADIGGLAADTKKNAAFDLDGRYHVKNSGVLALNGVLCRTAAAFEPGELFRDTNAEVNSRYYNW